MTTGWELGALEAAGERIVYPGLTVGELQSTSFYTLNLVSDRSIGNGYEWYHFKDVPILEQPLFFVSLCFFYGGLHSAVLSVQGKEYPTSWEDWTVEGELRRYGSHKLILAKELSRKPDYERKEPYPYLEYRYEWGRVSSYQDPRSGSTAISFTYEEHDK